MDLLLKTKIILKCLLISSRKYLTIDELNNDYSRSEGHNIPFNSLGFANLKDFLMSISDILSVSVIHCLCAKISSPTKITNTLRSCTA